MDALNALIEKLSLLSLAAVAIIVVGAVKSINGDITYTEFVTAIGPLAGLTAVARGIHAHGKARGPGK